jgi:hypothetical protein
MSQVTRSGKNKMNLNHNTQIPNHKQIPMPNDQKVLDFGIVILVLFVICVL